MGDDGQVMADHDESQVAALPQLLPLVKQLIKLPANDFFYSAFRAWYAEFDAEEWDRQLEADVAAGRLDWLVDEARRDNQEGRCTDR